MQSRVGAGFLAGIIGAVLVGLSGFAGGSVFFLGPLIAIIVGIVVGVLVARNPSFAGKSGGAGALAGLLAGALLFVAQIIGGAVGVNNSSVASDATVSVEATLSAQATATTEAGGEAVPPEQIHQVAQAGVLFVGAGLGCFVGLLNLGLAVGAGAAAGAIAGRGNQPPPVSPYGVDPYAQPPYNAGYPPANTGYPPVPGYGTNTSPQYPPYPPQQPPQNPPQPPAGYPPQE